MQAKAKPSPKKASKTDAGSAATPKDDSPQKQGSKRSAVEAVDVVNGTAADPPKRQKKVEADVTEADLQVCTSSAAGEDSQCRTPAEIPPSRCLLCCCSFVHNQIYSAKLVSQS